MQTKASGGTYAVYEGESSDHGDGDRDQEEQFTALENNDEDDEGDYGSEEEKELLRVLEDGDYGEEEEEVHNIYLNLMQKDQKPRTWAQGKKLRNDTKLQRGFKAGGSSLPRGEDSRGGSSGGSTWAPR